MCNYIRISKKTLIVVVSLILIFFIKPINGDNMENSSHAINASLSLNLLMEGQEHFFAGEYNESIEIYNQAIKLDPNSSLAWIGRGDALLSVGRYNESLENYDQAIELDPKSSIAWINRGNALLSVGRYHESLESYDQAIKLDPKSSLARTVRSLAEEASRGAWK